MHGGVPTYDYYYRWSLIAPALFLSAVLAFGALSLILISLPLRRIIHKYKETIFFCIMRDILMRTSTFLLYEFKRREKLKEVTHERDTFDGGEIGEVNLTKKITERRYYIFGVKVKKFFVHLLFLIIILMILTSAVSFFSTFLTETAFSCEENFDCFLKLSDDEYSNNRLEDCGNYTFNEIICFRLAYKYSEGLGEAGGFIFIMQVLINFLAWMAVRLGSKVGKHCNVWATTSLSLVISFAYIFTVILMPYFITLERPDVYDTFRSPQRQLQLFVYAYSNIVLVVIPPVGAYNAYPENTEMKNTSSMQPQFDFYKENPTYESEDEEYPSTQ